MKKCALLTVIAAAALGLSVNRSFADEQNDSPGNQKKGVPPGLQKKGGLPPGQAKKQARQQGTQSQAQPAAAPVTAPVLAKAPETPKEVTPPAPEPPKPSAPAPVPATPETKSAARVSPEIAARRAKLQAYVEEVDNMAQHPDVRDRMVVRLNRKLEVPLATIDAEQKNHPNVGMGGLLVAHHIAHFSKQSSATVLAAHKGGKSWGEIAGDHRVSLIDLIERMQDAKASARSAERESVKR